METIANCWPNMRHLSVGGPSLSSAGLTYIGKHNKLSSFWTLFVMNSSSEWYDVRNKNLTSLCHLLAKGCLRLQELELDRTIAINEEIAHAMCLCGLRGLETISFTFTPVSPGAIKELLGNTSWIFIWFFFRYFAKTPDFVNSKIAQFSS